MTVFLLDAQLDVSTTGEVAKSLNAFQHRYGCRFRSLCIENPTLKDPQVPGYCKTHGIDALVTENIRDFVARSVVFQNLLNVGISVIALRPGRLVLTPERQSAIILKHLRKLAARLQSAGNPLLIKLTDSGFEERTLEDLRIEILGQRSKLP